jgi:hypothetical protein
MWRGRVAIVRGYRSGTARSQTSVSGAAVRRSAIRTWRVPGVEVDPSGHDQAHVPVEAQRLGRQPRPRRELPDREIGHVYVLQGRK